MDIIPVNLTDACAQNDESWPRDLRKSNSSPGDLGALSGISIPNTIVKVSEEVQ